MLGPPCLLDGLLSGWTRVPLPMVGGLQLFGGDITVQHEQGTITVDDWIVYSAAARIAVLAKSIRAELDHLLQRKIARPETDITNSAVIGAIVQLLIAPY